MRSRFLHVLLLVLCLVAACNRDPEAAKKKYVENGNKYFEKAKYKEALIMYRKALQQDQKFGEAYYRAGLAELKLQRFADAARSLQRAVELQPKNLDAHTALTNLYLSAYLADPKRPKNILDELKSLAENYAANFPNTFERERLDGYLALFGNDLKKAEEHFAKANQIKPNQAELVLVYMQVLATGNRAGEGEKMGYDVLRSDPHALGIYDALYLQYMRTKRLADADRILIQKVENNPKVSDPYLQLAAHYFSTQRPAEMRAILDKMTANKTDFPKGRILVGDFYVRIRDFAMAAKTYRDGVDEGGPDKAAYQKRLVEVLVKQDKKDEATQVVTEILKANPKDDEAIAIRGALGLLSGTKDQIQNAMNDLQAVATRMPDNPVVRFNLGRALLAKGSPSLARVQFEEAVKIQPSYLPPRLMLAELMISNREFARAIQMSQEIMSYDPNNLGARLLRSRALIGIGDFKQARTELKATMDAYPTLVDGRLQVAALDLAEKNYKAAEENFRKIYTESQDQRAFMGLVETYVAQKQPELAAKVLREEVGKHPERLEYRATLANVELSRENYDAAAEEFKKVLEGAPRSGDIWQRLGDVYRRKGDIDAAVSAFRKAQEFAPGNPSPSIQLALIYDTRGQKDQARPFYEEALRIQPTNPIALNNLAYLLADTGTDLDQALTMARQAKQQQPNDVNISDTLGWVYIKKNLPDSAINIYRDLVAQEPNRASFRYHFALALAQKGDKISAKKELEAALRAKPAKDEEARIQALMSQLT